ncbi:unnamed protein product [Linum tenue]|uniref:Retrotransposon Copia-like N-terminal domain-containing protein n=1 Tax=Linum tenue TaxID=586396 RepID=A0AAV0HSK7_9ROSI|nr:unnamed protein product [Linum tenue]
MTDGDLTIGGGISYPTPDEDFPLPVIPTKLNRTNYHLWHRRVTVALTAADLIGYVNGEIKKPAAATDPNHRDWARSNATVLLWLLHTLADPIAQTFYRVETAAELWEQLEKSFGRPNPARLIDLKTQIFTIRQAATVKL